MSLTARLVFRVEPVTVCVDVPPWSPPVLEISYGPSVLSPVPAAARPATSSSPVATAQQ
jgi:hypothetical protein